MPLHPNFIKGLQFTEQFFDAAIKRAGGQRLTESFAPPQNVKSVDYLIEGYATELKVLVTDPLDASERQERLEKFLRAELPKGPLYVTAHKRQIALAGETANTYWEKVMGSSIRNRLQEAASQIRATNTFVPNLKGGAVILVNAGGPSLDWRSFIHLTNHFQDAIPEIGMVYAINGIPEREADGQLHIHSAPIAKAAHRADAEKLANMLDVVIREQIEKNTGKASKMVEVDAGARGKKVAFQITSSGEVKLKNPIRPLP